MFLCCSCGAFYRTGGNRENSKLLEILSFFFFGSGIELIAKVSEFSLRLSFGKVLFSSGFVLCLKGMKLASVVRMAFAENVHDLSLYRKSSGSDLSCSESGICCSA